MINRVRIAQVRAKVVSLLTAVGLGTYNVVLVVVKRVDVGLHRGLAKWHRNPGNGLIGLNTFSNAISVIIP